MTEDEYARLCHATDVILREPGSTIDRAAIAWLHVLNEHPVNLRQYGDVFGSSGRRRAVGFISALVQVRAAFRSRHEVQRVARWPAASDVVFVSHILNERQIGADDFYFGPLPELVQESGMTSCVVLHNATTLPGYAIESQWPSSASRRLVLPETLGIRQEMRLRSRLRSAASAIRSSHSASDKRVRSAAARYALAFSSIAALRFHAQFLALVDRLRPKAVVLTYEGHAWERLGFAAARQHSPGVRCLGYHHTILFPRQHAALRSFNRQLDPDVILTAGDVAAERFRHALRHTGISVATLGIHRREAGSDRSAVKTACLVIPDGIVSEVVRLFDIAIAAAALLPRVPFVLRLHPVVSIKALMKRFPRYQRLPANVRLSRDPIEDDIAISQWALYRGSNAAVYATIGGARPLYLEVPGELEIDSLKGLHNWRRTVRTPENLKAVIEEDLDGRAADRSYADQAAEYCRRYFMPLNPSVLLEAIHGRPAR
jgi:hypothetical protein